MKYKELPSEVKNKKICHVEETLVSKAISEYANVDNINISYIFM